MASIQGRYNFPAGESAMASTITELKSESRDVLTPTDMAGALMQAIEKKINNDGETFLCAPELMSATSDVLPQLNAPHIVADQQQQQMHFPDNNGRNAINDIGELKNRTAGWIDLSSKAESTIDENNENVAWAQLSNVGIAASTTELPLYYQDSTIDVDVKQQEQQSQDLFTNFESVVTNDFDLLSYLCEGNNSSQGDSVSTDSPPQDIKALSKWTSSSVLTDVLPKTCEPVTSSITASSDGLLKSALHTQDLSHSQASPNSAISSTSSGPNSLHLQESPNSPISTTSSAPTVFSHSSSCQLRSIVKLEEPETSTIKPHSAISRDVDINSNCNDSGVSRSKGRKRMLSNESESEDDGYRDTREKNNEASRKSRMNKKAKEQEMAKRAIELEKDNRVLKMKVEELEKLVSSMRNTLLRSALKKEIKDNIF